MSQTQTINTPQDYVNYTFNIEARGVAEVSSELMGLSNTVGNILGQLAFKTSEFLSHTDMLAIGTGAAISAMFVSATQDAIHFQQQIANVQAIGGETINAQAIGDAAMEYSNKFGMATSSMTEGLEALARAGITSTNVMKEVLAEGVKLSKLEGLDLEDSINDLISTTNLLAESGVDMNDPGYGQLVQQMNQHIVSTSESAPINAQNIIQSLQHVGGYASASGMDQEDLFAVIAQLGSRGTKGEMAGTALRAFIAAGQKDTAQRALARIGLNVSDLWNDNGETMLSISEMKDVLDNALEARGYSKQEKLEFYSDFAGYKQANQIMKIDTTEVQKYKENIANAWDLGKKLDVILGTVRGNLDRIWQTTQNFMTKVGSNLLGVMSAILTPVRVLLDVITKIPFADKAVAAGMIFVAFRTGLMIFNKLVPAIGGFMSGISGAKDETRSFRGEWRKTREEVQKTKEIIGLIKNRDQEGLAKKHYEEHGLSARNKMQAERDIAGQMYMASPWYQQHGRIPWESLHVAAQDMILERFKGTKEFKQNYNAFVDRTKANVDEIVSNPIIIEDFEGTDTLEAINVWVQEIFNLLNSDRTQGKFGDGNGGSSGPQSNQERNAQARILSNIFKNKVDGHTYGNYEFNYRDGEEGYNRLKDDINKLYDDIIKKTKDFKNTNVNNITNSQLNTYKKLFTGVSEAGRNNSLRANESEIRLVFEQGKTEHHEQPWQGLKDEQIRIIGRELGLDYENYNSQQHDRRSEIANEIHVKFESLYGDKTAEEQQAKIDEIIQKTNDEWIRQMPVGPAVDPKKILIDNPEIANQIVAQLNIDTSGANDNTQAVHSFFRDEANRTDENLRVAAKSAFEVLKANEMYSLPEQRELQYMLESLERMKNTMSVFEENAIDWGFSSELRDEMQQIIQDMNEHQNLFRGDAENLAAALVEGFVSEGLGRHSPGYMAQATEAEMMDVHRVFQSWITLIRRDTDVIQDILADFDKEAFPEVNETDSQDYQLLQRQYQQQTMSLTPDQQSSLAEFVGWYGFDMSNYQRFGLNYGKNLDDPAQFKTMLHYLNNDFDFEKWIDLFDDEDDYYDYLDAITEVMSNDWEYPQWLVFKDASFDKIGYSANGVNKAIERLYTAIFLDNMAKDMKDITLSSPGTFEDMMFYRGGVLPSNSEGLGEYLGATSTSFAKRIASLYTSNHKRRHADKGDYLFKYPTRIYAPEGVLGVYPNTDLTGSLKYENIYDNQQEYTLGSGQPFIELPTEKTGKLSNNAMDSVADILLLTPEQSAQVQSAVIDEINDMGDAIASSTILSQRGIELGRSFVDAFIEDGLGRHSPGYMVEAVKAEMQDMHDVINADDTEDIVRKKMSGIHGATKQSLSRMGGYWHNVPLGMLWDTANYFKGVKNKRVIDQETFFKTIEQVHGADLAQDARDAFNDYYTGSLKENGKIVLTKLNELLASDDLGFGVQPITGKLISANDVLNAGDMYDGMIESEYWRYIPGAENIGTAPEFLAAVINGDISGVDMDTPLFRKSDRKDDKSDKSDDYKFSNLFAFFTDFETQAKVYEKLYGRKLPQEIWGSSSFQQFGTQQYGGGRFMVSPHEVFDLMKQYPHLVTDGLEEVLKPYLNIGETPTPDTFKDLGIFDEKFIPLPARHAFFMGIDENDLDSYTDLSVVNEADPRYKFKPTLAAALEAWAKMGPDAMLSDAPYMYDDNLKPTVENSFERMMLGLVYGTLDDMSDPHGARTPGGGIHIFPHNTELYSAEETLDTLIHEFTHMALQQDYRHALDPSHEMYLPEIKDKDATKLNYKATYPWLADEFETNWVVAQVFSGLGLEEISRVDERVKGFYDIVDKHNATQNLQWELYDEWIKVITENIDKFIDMAEAFDIKYSDLDADEISDKWNEIRELAGVGQEELYMPGSSFNTDYMNYMNEQLKAQQEAAKRQQDATAGYKDWYEEQKAEQERMYGLRTEYERTEMGRLHIAQEQLRLEEEGKKNAEENRRKQRERWEQQRKPFEEERKKRGALMVVDQPEEPKSRWDELRDKVREKLGGGYYYFGGERKEREQSGYQKWAQKWAFKGIDYAERADEKINEKSKQLYDSIKETDAFGNLSDKITTTIQPIQDFTDVLSSLSEVFPILTPAVLLLNQALDFAGVAIEALTALQAYNTAVTAANTTSKELNTLAEEGNTFATFLNTMAKWQNAEAGTVKNAIGSVVGKATDILADGIGIIGEMSVGTMAAILGPILAVIAAIEVVKFWENKHAEALKETQKALEESTARNNIALSQYKDLKNARESETNAIKKQQAARKEAIALYELEAARVNRQKSVYDEAKVRNDAIWGEYGERARLQKMGWLESIFAEGIPFLGTIGKWQAGEFESQYEKYDGTTASIRKIKESTLGQLFGGSPEANYVSRVYDSNSMFFAQVEAYKEPLQELYDKESQLIEQYGSIDLARGTKEFEDAVQEFADATNLNGETAGMMLDWLETENRVDQASKVGQAMIGRIQAQTQARIMENEANGQYGLSEMSTLGDAMLYAEFKELMNTAKTESWWNLLHAQLDAILTALNPVNWINGELSKKNRNVEAYRSELETLNTQGGEIYDAMKEAYDSAERREYGSRNLSDYGDTPFGGAIESAGAQYADAKQQRMFARTGQTMSEDQYLATQQQYQEDKFGITNEQLEANRRKDTQRAYQKAQAEKNRKANSTLGQLQFNGDRAHYDALAIINAIEKSDRFGNGQGSDSDTAGGVMGTIIGLAKIGLNAGAGVANSGIRALLSAGSGAEYSIRGLLSGGPNVSGLLEGGGESTSIFSRLKNLFNIKNLKGSPILSKISEILFGKQVPGLTSGGVYATEGGIVPTAKAIFQTLKSGYAEGGIKGLFSAGGDIFNAARGSAGKSGIFSKISDIIFGRQVPGLTTPGTYATEGGIIPTAKALFQKGKSSLPNIKDILFGKQVEGLAVRPGDYMMEGGLLSKGKMGINQIKTLLRDGGLKTSVASKFSDILYGKQVPGLTTPGTYATEGGIIPTAKALFQKGKSSLPNIKDILFGKQVEGLAVRPGDYMMEGGLLSKGKMGINQIKTLLRDGGLKTSVASKFSDILYGKQVPGLTTPGTYATEGGILPTARAGLSRLKGAFSGGFEGSSVLSNIRGFASSSNVRGFGSSVAGEMKGMFNPKTISGGLSDVAGGLKGGGTLLKGASKLAGPAAAVLGGAITFAEEYAEHDPSKTHYNDDGTEKKAFQSTGEVVGSTAGSVVGGLGGAIAGAEMGGMAGAAIGSIVPGLGTAIGGAVGTVAGGIIGGIVGEETMRRAGDAIGGTLGWIGDQLYNALPDEAKNAWNTIVGIAGKAWDGITDIAGKAWQGLSGIFGGIWDAVSGAAGGAWNFITGADDTSNNPVKGILGLHPIGMAINAASGISNWLFGSENDPYQNVQQTTDNKKVPQKLSNAQNTVVIKNININTEDDPEKIKSALMNLIIEMQEQVNPRQVSRVVGEAPQQTTSTTTDTNNQNQAEGTDSQNTDPNNPNANQNNNNNPTV